jgi:hypothetical protein
MLTVKCWAVRFASKYSFLVTALLGRLRAFTPLYASAGETLQSFLSLFVLGAHGGRQEEVIIADPSARPAGHPAITSGAALN